MELFETNPDQLSYHGSQYLGLTRKEDFHSGRSYKVIGVNGFVT